MFQPSYVASLLLFENFVVNEVGNDAAQYIYTDGNYDIKQSKHLPSYAISATMGVAAPLLYHKFSIKKEPRPKIETHKILFVTETYWQVATSSSAVTSPVLSIVTSCPPVSMTITASLAAFF